MFPLPDILLLDEPTNHLDTKGLEWLTGFLKHFKGTVIMVTHDQVLIENTSDRFSELSTQTKNLKHFSGGYARYIEAQEIEIKHI